MPHAAIIDPLDFNLSEVYDAVDHRCYLPELSKHDMKKRTHSRQASRSPDSRQGAKMTRGATMNRLPSHIPEEDGPTSLCNVSFLSKKSSSFSYNRNMIRPEVEHPSEPETGSRRDVWTLGCGKPTQSQRSSRQFEKRIQSAVSSNPPSKSREPDDDFEPPSPPSSPDPTSTSRRLKASARMPSIPCFKVIEEFSLGPGSPAFSPASATATAEGIRGLHL
jgi:hypothetical protein